MTSSRLAGVVALVLGAAVLFAPPLPALGLSLAVDPIPGPQSSGDVLFPNVGNGGYDVSHYDVNIAWTPGPVPGPTLSGSIVATTTIAAATTGAPLSSYSLDLEGLTVDSVTVNGQPAAFTRVVDAGATKYKLVVTPTTAVDGAFTTVVAYHGTPSSHTDADGSLEGWNATTDGATFLNQPVGSMTGFPNNNTPSDKATYTFTLDIPTTITSLIGGSGPAAAVSNGELVSQTPNAGTGRTVWVWDQDEPMASELSLISIGKYQILTSTLALDNGTQLPEWTFVDSTLSVPASRLQLKNYIDFFEDRYGPYPGNSTGMVVDVVPSGISYALETQDRAFFPGSAGTTTTIHEVMHQWFGDAVSPKVWNDIWLNEGPATYSEVQYPDEAGTETTFFNEWSSTPSNSSTWTTPAAAMTDSADLFGSHVYDRGAMALEALRTAIGASDFAALMLEWQDRYGGGSPGTAAFIDLAEEFDGRDLAAFFQDWIYDADKPVWPGKFNLALASSPASGGVGPGQTVTYTLSAQNTGKVSLTGAVVTVELADVLDDATLNALPGGLALGGTTLTWTVPSTALSATSQATFSVVVDSGLTDGDLDATARATTLGSTCTTCHSALNVVADPISPAPDPTITGTAKVGSTLTAVTGTWEAGTTFAYQWRRAGADISGATLSTYVARPADLGQPLSLRVTGSKPGRANTSRTSAPTSPVVRGVLTKTPVPTITGKVKPGKRLTVQPGTWDPGVTLTFQWYVAGQAVPGADGARFKVRKKHLGDRIRVRVTGTKPGYVATSVLSKRTAPVA